MIEWSYKNYSILGLPEGLNNGQVRLKMDKNSTVRNAVEYITLRHSLLTGLDMKTQGMDYLVYKHEAHIENSKDYLNKTPINHLWDLFTPKSLLTSLEKCKNLVLFDGITKILLDFTNLYMKRLSLLAINILKG